MMICVNQPAASLAKRSEYPRPFNRLNGAPDKVRTRDPLITNQVLYQLSYKGSGGLISQARQKKSQKTVFGEEKPAAFGDLQQFAQHA
jgi:hypothetical protein